MSTLLPFRLKCFFAIVLIPWLLNAQYFECYTQDLPFEKNTIFQLEPSAKSSSTKTLNIHVEIAYPLYLESGQSENSCSNWVANVFAQVKSLFAIHNIDLQFNLNKVWDQQDPFTSTSLLSDQLVNFGNFHQNNISGDIALLISHSNSPSGLANLQKLCVDYNPQDHSGPYAIVNVKKLDFETGFDYNKNAHLIAHELGHVIGSRHTHACVWGPQQNQALDYCSSPEGSCGFGPSVSNGGTIMSYCDRYTNIGVNFNNGYGYEPGNLIYNLVSNADCQVDCIEEELCDDGDHCTSNDQLDENCNCIGILIDNNKNGLCDLNEICKDYINADTLNLNLNQVMARMSIIGSKMFSQENLTFNAGDQILLLPGFEINNNKTFEAKIEGCN